ncbi:MAG: YiiD C-terminal domain-containing protein [Campylobacterota bacterium]
MEEILQKKLYSEIPLTKLMKLHIKEYSDSSLITTAPLDININDKGTAFGGSLSTITIISAWSMCYLISKELGYDSKNIAIIKNNTSYKRPVTKDIYCITKKPSIKDINSLKAKLEDKKTASIKIESNIIENDEICVKFEGVYVIKL